MTYSFPRQSQSTSGLAPSFGALIADAEAQIETELFSPEDLPLAENVAMMIAEIEALPKNETVRIGGAYLPVPLVREIYARLDHDLVADVIRRFSALPYTVKRPKTYLRTALYNAVFEQDAAATNAYGKDHAL